MSTVEAWKAYNLRSRPATAGKLQDVHVKGKVILVVDDAHITRQGTVLVVSGLGFETDEAADGFEALDKFKSSTYAAILMDYNMPKMDGFECTAKIRDLEKGTDRRIPIIGMTASTDRDIREACLKAGMDDYVEKSCTNAELEEMLLKWVGVAEKADRV